MAMAGHKIIMTLVMLMMNGKTVFLMIINYLVTDHVTVDSQTEARD